MRGACWASSCRRAAGLGVLATLLCSLSAAATDNADIYGRWSLTRLLDSADIAAMPERQARALVGTQVVIAPDRFVIGSRTCRHPSYERSLDDLPRSFREQGHVSSANMGLPDPVTAIDARCTHIYLKAPGRIVVQWDGYYYDAEKLKPIEK
ncbi:hypothetical protein [Duganella vulcania]|uniref:DUF3617 family protein n=1 Tax=Duganella vulcania TaxID=2692166 RepID=A0A845GUX9_9BURK|nr:hypothetical protein [Duganella vulcania]MYM97016.1 hypothetical protein [Duganella vulcania]